MAGIGFRLEKILSRNSYLNLLEGYAYSAVVSAGPVLFTIFSILILTILSYGKMDPYDVTVFRTLVVYIYGFSLILSSFSQMVLTRYIADRIFVKDFKALIPAFVGLLCMSILLHAIVGVTGSLFLDLGFGIEITAIVLFITIGISWIAMILLSGAKEYIRIVHSFMVGSILSIFAGFFLGKYFGLLGLLSGFTVGQVTLVILLVVQVFTEFDFRKRIEFYFFQYFRKYTALAFIATFYNIGVWGDKFVFWFSPETRDYVHGFLYASPSYDVPVFLAYLFIVPSLAMVTIRVETSFYIHYKKYFLSILNKHPYVSLDERRKNILKDLYLSLGRMLVFQGTITLIGIVFSNSIYERVGMSAMGLAIFQVVILATFLQSLLLPLLLMMLYFDFRLDALIMSAIFAITNIVLSRLSIELGYSYYGYGYLGSCFLALLTGFILFNYRLKHLLFYTFVSQRIIVHVDTAEA
ncbi:MAG: exopolysaccharide Pel transporter PelG [Pseudomonadota bacterium]